MMISTVNIREQSNTAANSGITIKLFGYRWIIIAIYALLNIVSSFQFMQFTIIADIVERYYDVNSFLGKMTGTIFLISFIAFCIPVGYIVRNTTLRTSALISIGLTAAGNCLKLLAVSPNSFSWVLTSQFLCGIAQVFMLITPARVANRWFGANELSTAGAMGIFGNQLGISLGSVIPALVVKSGENKNVTEQRFYSLFLYNAIVTLAVLIIVILFFRKEPSLPPSISQANMSFREENNQLNFFSIMKELFQNKNYLIVICTIGDAYGLSTAFAILFNQVYLEAFPDDDASDVGILASIASVSGGCFGNMIFGYILDKTHKFKLVTSVVLIANTITSIGQAVCLLIKNKCGAVFFIPLNGFFSGSLLVLCSEYVIETTHPTPEAIASAILMGVTCIFAVFYVFSLSIIFHYLGYIVGHSVIVLILALMTFGALFLSPELKRWNANLHGQVNHGFSQSGPENHVHRL